MPLPLPFSLDTMVTHLITEPPRLTLPNRPARQLHKFGGSSLADPQGFQRVANIIGQYSGLDDLIIVSAAGNSTNQLIQWVSTDRHQSAKTLTIAEKLQRFQRQLISRLLNAAAAKQLLGEFEQEWHHLQSIVANPHLNEAQIATVVGYGEIWAARLLAALLNQQGMTATWLDACCFLRAARAAQPKIDEGRSYPLLAHCLAQYPHQRLVITGFISSNAAGETVLLGRNGSDYSATQIGALANVCQVTLWSDVAGIYTADPRVIPDACLLPQLRLDEANALARLAVPILHPRTLQPLSSSSFALCLRSSHHPTTGSTRIERALVSTNDTKVIAHHDNIFLLKLQIHPSNNLLETLQHITQQLQQATLPPLTWGIQEKTGALQWSYTHEMIDSAHRYLQQLLPASKPSYRQGYTLLALVGHQISQNQKQRDYFYQLLDQPTIEHRWQALEGHSLAVVLRSKSSQPWLRPLHQALFQRQKRLGIVLWGRGVIARNWLLRFAEQQQRLINPPNQNWILCGVIDQQRAWLDYQGVDPHRVLAFFDDEAKSQPLATIQHWLTQHQFETLVILDTTQSTTLTTVYPDFIKQGLSMISSNRMLGALDHDHYLQLTRTAKQTGARWGIGAALAGGLPIYRLLQSLSDSGDKLVSLSASLDTPLNWLLQHYDSTLTFTNWIKQAWCQGLMHSDPRRDLQGEWVAYQLVLLVRAAGYRLEATQIQVESLINPEFMNTPLEIFFSDCNPLNRLLSQRLEAARAAQLTLCYVARFSAKTGARIGIEALDPQHPLAKVAPDEQLFLIESRCYQDPPLMLRGPANRPEVVAGALQAELRQFI